MSKKVSSKDVALAAGVSQATVSYVLNDTPGVKIKQETRRIVLQTARSLGYQAPRKINAERTQAAGVIGLAVDRDLPAFVMAAAEDGIKYAAVERDSAVMLFYNGHGQERADAYISRFNEGALDGVIYFFTAPPAGEEDALTRAGVPYLLVSGTGEASDAVQVTNEIEPALNAVIARFAAMGAAEVAYIGAAAGHKAAHRYVAYEKALARHGLPFRQHLVRHIGGSDPEMELEIARYFEGLDAPPRAIICDAPQTGFLTLRYAHQTDIDVPDEMAVVTIGTSPFSGRVYPSLSCVEAPLLEMGEVAAKTLFEMIDARFAHETPRINRDALKLEWRFTERESTKGFSHHPADRAAFMD